MKKYLVFLSLTTTSIIGCSNPYAQFYHDLSQDVDISTLSHVILPTKEPKILQGANPDQDALRMLEENYNIIGYSFFNAGEVDRNGAVQQAKKVHASVVILYSEYTGSISGAVPLTMPDTTTSSTSLYGNMYGASGYTSFSGTAYTTTYGTQTTYVPYTVHRSNYLATYWIKMKPRILGALVGDLSPERRLEIGSNKGVQVSAVIKDSPAFDADILIGDVIRKIGGIEIINVDCFVETLRKFEGSVVDVIIIRGDKEFYKLVTLRTRS